MSSVATKGSGNAWSYLDSMQLLAKMVVSKQLDAAPHESIFCRVAEELSRSETISRARFLRLRLVLEALGKWSVVEGSQGESADSLEGEVQNRLARDLADVKGYIRLLDLYCAAVRIARGQRHGGSWPDWIPEFPVTLNEALSDTQQIPSMSNVTYEKLRKHRDQLCARIRAAINGLALSTTLFPPKKETVFEPAHTSPQLPGRVPNTGASTADQAIQSPFQGTSIERGTASCSLTTTSSEGDGDLGLESVGSETTQPSHAITPEHPAESPVHVALAINPVSPAVLLVESPVSKCLDTLDAAHARDRRERNVRVFLSRTHPQSRGDTLTVPETLGSITFRAMILFMACVGPDWAAGSKHTCWMPMAEMLGCDAITLVKEWRKCYGMLKNLRLWSAVRPVMVIGNLTKIAKQLTLILSEQKKMIEFSLLRFHSVLQLDLETGLLSIASSARRIDNTTSSIAMSSPEATEAGELEAGGPAAIDSPARLAISRSWSPVRALAIKQDASIRGTEYNPIEFVDSDLVEYRVSEQTKETPRVSHGLPSSSESNAVQDRLSPSRPDLTLEPRPRHDASLVRPESAAISSACAVSMCSTSSLPSPSSAEKVPVGDVALNGLTREIQIVEDVSQDAALQEVTPAIPTPVRTTTEPNLELQESVDNASSGLPSVEGVESPDTSELQQLDPDNLNHHTPLDVEKTTQNSDHSYSWTISQLAKFMSFLGQVEDVNASYS